MAFKMNIKNHILESKQEWCTYDFGTREPEYRTHKGVDVTNDAGGACNVIAAADGEVVYVQDGVPGYDEKVFTAGNFVRLKHTNGVYTRYLHMVNGSIKVKVGDKVKAGTVLGKEGNTGYSLGTHLHFDVNDGQGYVDPMPYLRGEKLFNKITNGNSTKDNGVKIGATCTVNKGAKFSDGTAPASFVYTTTFTVLNISNDNTEVLIGLNGAATGWIKVVDTSLAGSVPSTTTFKVGDKCRVKSGAKFSNGVTPDEWVFEYEFKILSLSKNGKEAKIGTTDGAATGWIYLSDLYKGKTTSAATVIRVGDRVKIKKNASWFGCSNKINDWRNEKVWIVEEVVKNRAVLGRDTTGVFNIMSAIDVKYLIKQ